MTASFERLEPLATGGTCELFHARNALGVRGVWKQLHPHLRKEPSQRERFAHEATVLRLVKHRNIVALLEHGTHEDVDYLVLEYVSGPSLASLRGRGPAPLPLWLGVAAGLSNALSHVHERTDANGVPLSIVHRDVSPDNVLLHPERGPVLLDFGLACSVLAPQERDGVLRGTPGYLAPEAVLLEQPIDARADVFSLAVVLHELATGERLFPGSALVAAQATLTAVLPSPSAPPSLVPPSLGEALLRALERSVERRTPSARALLESLKKARSRSVG